MNNLTTEITTSALDAARAEGRIDAAVEIQRLADHWLIRCQFREAFQEILAIKIEEYRREQSRAINRYVEVRKELVQ